MLCTLDSTLCALRVLELQHMCDGLISVVNIPKPAPEVTEHSIQLSYAFEPKTVLISCAGVTER